MLGPGDVLGDRYRLDEFIASGGMGQVFRATDKILGRTVAVKVLLPGHVSNAEFGSRFRSEARIMASIGHQGVVGVYDYGETPEGTLFLVMAFVNGQPLGERINAAGSLSVSETLDIVAQAADALHAAHERGIIHRDVKPGNLLVGEDGAVTLVDFGVARSAEVTSVTKVNAVIGTALYMSPEQASGRPISPSADIYALGVVAYHCLTGAPPFGGNTPLEIAIKHLQDEPPPLPATVPVATRALVERAMAKDPEERFPTAAALAAAARGAQDATLDDDSVPHVRGSVPPVVTTPSSADDSDDDEGDGSEPAGRPVWVPIAAGVAIVALVAGVVLAVVALSRKVIDPPESDAKPSATASAVSTTDAPGAPAVTHQPTHTASTATSSAAPTEAPASSAPGTQPASSGPPPPTSKPPAEPTTEAPTPPPASAGATGVVKGGQ